MRCGGIITDIATDLNVTRLTVYRWLDHYGMRDALVEARQDARGVCVDVFYERVMSEDEDKRWEAAMFGLRHLRDDGEFSNIPRELLQILQMVQAQGGDLTRVASHLRGYVEASDERNGRLADGVK
jgi:hypothetical protein